jgi:FlaA1/EpsC-like NDP-sugar epimerase
LYFKVWQSSFFKDYLYLILAILLGSVVSLALLLTLNEGNEVLFSINVMALFVLFASVGVVGIRIVHYFIRAWATDNANNDNARHIIIYGAGAYGILYLHECYLKNTSDPGTINIIGFMEDVLYIKNDHVYGKTVLGGMSELSNILTEHTVDEIVVTGDISDDVCSQLKNIIHNSSIKLLKWDTLATHMV